MPHGTAIEPSRLLDQSFREAGKTAQIEEQRCNFSAVAFKLLLCSRRDDQIGTLLRKNVAAYSCARFHLLGLRRAVQAVGLDRQIIKQPRILNGDDGLRGKVFYQLDLLVGERSNFLTVDEYRADRFIVFKHGNAEHCSCAGEPCKLRAGIAGWYIKYCGAFEISAIWTGRFVASARSSAVAGAGRIIGSRCRSSTYAFGAPRIETIRNTSPSRRKACQISPHKCEWRFRASHERPPQVRRANRK